MLKVLSLLRLPTKCFYIDCDYDSDVIISSCRLLVRKLAVYENIVEFVENNNDNKDNNNNNRTCSSRKYPYPPPPQPYGGQRLFRREGDPKGGNFWGGGGLLREDFFPVGVSKIGELLINNSFSVQQAISHFLVSGVSKQELLFALIVFYLLSGKCFFHGLRDRFLTYNCHQLMNKLPVI